jgi:excinuclease UvrABC helicase subunit UvrB
MFTTPASMGTRPTITNTSRTVVEVIIRPTEIIAAPITIRATLPAGLAIVHAKKRDKKINKGKKN